MTDSIAFEIRLPLSFDAAIERVTAALKEQGFGILTRIDVHKTLKEKIGADFRPYAILGACNPPLAHRALSHDARAGLLLPCNVTVETAGTDAVIRIGDPDAFLALGGFDADPTLRQIADEARDRLKKAADAIANA